MIREQQPYEFKKRKLEEISKFMTENPWWLYVTLQIPKSRLSGIISRLNEGKPIDIKTGEILNQNNKFATESTIRKAVRDMIEWEGREWADNLLVMRFDSKDVSNVKGWSFNISNLRKRKFQQPSTLISYIEATPIRGSDWKLLKQNTSREGTILKRKRPLKEIVS
jgi:hypothetical protein